MKIKEKIQTLPTIILNEPFINLSYISKNVGFDGIKKEYPNKRKGLISNKRPKNRQNNSLDKLTKRFIIGVYELGNETINLNLVMKKIKAKKRRIYDITNVLEGRLKLF